jgi:transcriptional regulator with XRE-family HTH domain
MDKAQPKRRPWELTAFGALLKEHLHDRGLKQGELASNAGISQETLSRAIHGKQKPGADVVSKLSAALELSPEEKLRLIEAVEHDYAAPSDSLYEDFVFPAPIRTSQQRKHDDEQLRRLRLMLERIEELRTMVETLITDTRGSSRE